MFSYINECEEVFENTPATYVRKGNAITVTSTYEEYVEVYEDVIILTISGNTVSLVIPEGYYVEGDDFEVEVEQDLTLVFTIQ